MVPAVQALLVALACLLAPPPAGSAPACVPVAEAGTTTGIRARAADPAAVVEALPALRDEAGEGFADEEDDEYPARPRPATDPARFDPVPGLAGVAGASTHPAFHAVARSRFLLFGRLTC